MSIDYMVMDETRVWFSDEYDEDECHIVCLKNKDWSLCGQDVSGHDWVPDDDPVEDCPCCDEFDRADFCAHCAMGES